MFSRIPFFCQPFCLLFVCYFFFVYFLDFAFVFFVCLAAFPFGFFVYFGKFAFILNAARFFFFSFSRYLPHAPLVGSIPSSQQWGGFVGVQLALAIAGTTTPRATKRASQATMLPRTALTIRCIRREYRSEHPESAAKGRSRRISGASTPDRMLALALALDGRSEKLVSDVALAIRGDRHFDGDLLRTDFA